MNLTVDQKIRMLIGEYAIQITALETQLAQKIAENETLKAKLAALAPPEHGTASDDASPATAAKMADLMASSGTKSRHKS